MIEAPLPTITGLCFYGWRHLGSSGRIAQNRRNTAEYFGGSAQKLKHQERVQSRMEAFEFAHL
jgi:hypothetical protein